MSFGIRKLLCFTLAVALGGGMIPVHAQEPEPIQGDGYTITKISNPDHGEREADGLKVGGDREVGYLWSIEERGDYLYIGTWRNTVGEVIRSYLEEPIVASGMMDAETVWDLVDVFTNGEVPHRTEGRSQIIKVNKETYEQEVIYEANEGVSFRNAKKFDNKLFFATYVGAAKGEGPSIVMVDEDDNCTVVYHTEQGAAVRANAVFEGSLYFGGTDTSYEVDEGDEGAVKLAILKKDEEDDTKWDRVADYRDFGEYAYDSYVGSSIGAPFWEMAALNGWLYGIMPGMSGFVVFRGRPAQDGEEANAYGWHWEEVVGAHNGINNQGLHPDNPAGYTDPTNGLGYHSVIGAFAVFNDELYILDYDHTIGCELVGFQGVLSLVSDPTSYVASDYLYPLYNSLKHPQSVWKMNNDTGKFEKCLGFAMAMENTTNEYVWRGHVYDNELYISTMDSAVIYNYLTRVSNGSLFKMSQQEWEEQISYIANLVQKLVAMGISSNEYVAELVDIYSEFVEMMSELSEIEPTQENLEFFVEKYGALLNRLVDLFARIISDILNGTAGQDGIVFIEAALDEKAVSTMDLSLASSKSLESKGITLLDNGNIDYAQLPEDNEIISQLKAMLEAWQERFEEIYNAIDWKGIMMYAEISKIVKDDVWGFDMLKTSDGETWTLVTSDGFGDKYNYGGLRYMPTEKGMYITTANPFYGGQLYLLEKEETVEWPAKYTVTDNASAKWLEEDDIDLVFGTDADETVIAQVFVDDELVKLENLVFSADSIALKKDYVLSLDSAKEHTIKFLFTDSGTAQTTFTITLRDRYTGFRKADGSPYRGMYPNDIVYWYEDDIKQGVYGDLKNVKDTQFGNIERGREIFDPASKAWYWLDANAEGAIARNKEVWLPYVFQDEEEGSTPGKWVRYDKYGQMIKGWYANDNGIYYYDLETGAMYKGTHTIAGKSYTFDELTGIRQ